MLSLLFPKKKVTKENSRLHLPLLLLVLLVGSVLTEPDDAGFGWATTGSAFASLIVIASFLTMTCWRNGYHFLYQYKF